MEQTMLDTYKQLKSEMEAAYAVFKHNPTVNNASSYTAATQAFTNFCISSMASMANLQEPEDKHDEILNNIDDYETCKQCDAKILYKVDNDHFVESSEFLADFPGWCYNCLVEHCKSTDCVACAVSEDPSTCSFKAVKDLLMNNN